MVTFTVYAEDGEYREDAPVIHRALDQFRQRRPGIAVAAVVDDGMRPRLVLAAQDDVEALREPLAEARAALAGDSNDAEHDALRGLADAVAGLLGGQ